MLEVDRCRKMFGVTQAMNWSSSRQLVRLYGWGQSFKFLVVVCHGVPDREPVTWM